MNRSESLARLRLDAFDVLVVGGGIYGAAILREATAQGLRAALVEQADFAGATSANSLKIIHGGLRYLQQADLPRVFESIRERSLLLRNAPHLVRPFPCVLPTQRSFMKSRFVMFCGLLINDILSFNRNFGLRKDRRIPHGRTLSRSRLLSLLPQLDSTPDTGAAAWTDAFVHDSERLPFSMILDAAANDAVAVNYVRAESFLYDEENSRVSGIVARDRVSGDSFPVHAAIVVNAAGAWSDELLASLPRPLSLPKTHWALAVNLILRHWPVTSLGQGLAPQGSRRQFFFGPWRGRVIAGTFYRDFSGSPSDLAVTEADIDALLADINGCLPSVRVSRSDVLAVHAGVLPCSRPPVPGREPALLHHSRIVDHERSDRLPGLVSVCSIKYTTARGIAEKTVRLAMHRLDRPWKGPLTRSRPPPGAGPESDADLAALLRADFPAVSDEDALRILSIHGNRLPEFLAFAHKESPSDLLRAEVLFSLQNEMPLSLGDLLFRRIAIATAGDPDPDLVRRAAAVMASERHWSAERLHDEISAVLSAKTLFMPAPPPLKAAP